MPDDKAPPRPRRDAWLDRHLWQIQPVRDVGMVALVLFLIYLGRLASVVTVPLLLAIMFAYLFEPVVRRLQRLRGFTRPRAVIGIIAALVTFIVLPAGLALIAGAAQTVYFVQRLADSTGKVIQSVEKPLDEQRLAALPEEGPWRWLRDHLVDLRTGAKGGGEAETVVRWIQENARSIATGAMTTGADALSGLLALLGGAVQVSMTVFFTAFFFYFIASGWPRVIEFFEALVPDARRDRVRDLAAKMDRVVSGFVRGRLTIAVILGLFWSIGYAAIGVPAAIVLGFATGALAVAPYAAIVSVPIAVVLLWLEGHAGLRGSLWWVLLAPVVVYNAGQFLDDYFLTPRIQGKETDMDIPTILVAVLAGGALLGFFGLLLAIPLAACIKILIREVAWPRFKAWTEGRDKDFLPVARE